VKKQREAKMRNNGVTRRQFSKTAVMAASALALPYVARAQQNYPSRPIRFIIPFAAGGVADITARLAAEKLGDTLGQRLVIENQPGPGGIAAARAVLSAPPDGHTLGLISNGTAISVALFNALPFDPVKDFAPISTLGTFALVFGTNAQSRFRTLQDFITAAREQPGKLNVGTIAVGSTQHLGAELFKSTAGLDFQIIPYRGTPEVVIALLRDDIQLMDDFYAAMKGGMSDNKIRALATSGPERASYLPDVPTVQESGVPGYDVTSWNGVVARAGTPAEIINLLNGKIREVVAMPEVKAKYADLGIEAKASSPDEMKARLASDITKWAAVVEKSGIPKQ
jgi:tripartite-type tricarboxylate transporter receptor subunit TctC